MGILSLTDQLMVGQLGDHAVGVTGISGQLTSLLTFVLLGLVTGIGAFTAQFWSRGDRGATRGTFRFSAMVSLGIALPLAAVGALAPMALMRPFTTDYALMSAGSDYLRLISASFLPTAGVVAASGLLRSMGKMRVPLYASVAAVLINLALDWTLMFGNLGAPRFGLLGGGIGTLAARVIECAVLLIVVRRTLGFQRVRGAISPVMYRRMIMTAAPLVLNELMWILSENSYTAVYGHMGTGPLVAMSMTYPLQNVMMAFFAGLAAAATPLLGGSLGLGQRGLAQADARQLMRVSLIASTASVMVVIALAAPYCAIYHVSADVKPMALACLMVFAGYLPLKAQNRVIYDGVLATGGDTRYFFITGTIATWFIGVPLAFTAAFVLHYPIWLVYLLLSIEEAVRFVIGLRRVRSTKWMRIDLTDAV
jgi:putative MATE family efflux protein